MKFLADMGISPSSVRLLRADGHDAVHLIELGLNKLSDAGILAKARSENRVVLTNDLDFGDLMAASGDVLPSVISFRLANMRPENVNGHLRAILTNHSDLLKDGAIISVTEQKIRARRLPIR
jgi:predicted nuclease of predicted toxin-antitoxin system